MGALESLGKDVQVNSFVLHLGCLLGKPEVDEPELVTINEDVGGGEVPVDNIVRVEQSDQPPGFADQFRFYGWFPFF